MPRKITGSVWGIRITMDISPIDEEPLFKIPNTVCVYHAGGKRKSIGFKEKPHYHLYYKCDEDTTKETVQQYIKSNAIVAKYYKASNAFWSVDTDTSYTLESYWEYVWKDYPQKKQRLIWWDIPEPQLPIPQPIESLITVGNVVALGPISAHRGREKKVPTSLEKQQKFLQYCKDYYGENTTKSITPKRILKLLYEYCKNNGFTTETCCFVWVNYVMANLTTGAAYKECRGQFVSRLENKFF